MKNFVTCFIISLLLMLTTGCVPTRFVVDTSVPQDELTETVVLDDDRPSAKIAMIEITGLIADARTPGLLGPGENPVATFVESLDHAADDSRTRAIIIRINSPGGTVTSSDLIYREVMRFRKETSKPVVMLMGDVAASGGYYLACAGDEIIAMPTTITGSIGVIMQTVNVSRGLDKLGIKAEAITSGPNKSMGSPFEPMADEHRQLMQEMVDEFYVSFRELVVERRPSLSESDIDWVTDGRVVSGTRAAEIGLVDRTGDLHDAFEAAKRLAGIERATLVKYHRPLQYVGSAYASSPIHNSELNIVKLDMNELLPLMSPGFYYLWSPGSP